MDSQDERREKEIDIIIQEIQKGNIKIYTLERRVGSKRLATEIRRIYLEKTLHLSLNYISKYSLDPESVIGRNIENMIGTVEIPVGIVGPININGEYAKGDFYIPLATTEGALVASVNRGSSALTESSGVKTTIIDDKMTRSPVLECPNGRISRDIAKWIRDNIDYLQENVISRVTSHGKLISVEPYIVGKYVYLRFKFITGDAMGMNMVTIASEEVMKFVEQQFPVCKYIALSGNMCVDKKPSAMNFINGRGKTVIAEAIINRKIVQNKLKTTPQDFVKINSIKNLLGSAHAVSMGFNAHFANIIAAIFIATGQDPAQVVEGSQGLTFAEVTRSGDLYVSIKLTSLEVGTIGGGTRLPHQRELLSIMGIGKNNLSVGENSKLFAEIIAAAVLAGEISLISAIASKHFAEAHKKLGR